MEVFISIVLAAIYGNGMEWVLHKYLFHEMGKKKSSPWSFHLHEHHRDVRRDSFVEKKYGTNIFSWSTIKDREFIALLALLVIHFPVAFLFPYFFIGITLHAMAYYLIHRKSHCDEEWAKKYVPWHWDHHMGPSESINANWCVTFPLFDWIMNTRIKHHNKQREKL